MKNLQITRHVTIAAAFTAEQWGLYPDASRDAAVASLNQELVVSVNELKLQEFSVRTRVEAVMRRFSSVGANDSEAHIFLTQVLEEIFR